MSNCTLISYPLLRMKLRVGVIQFSPKLGQVQTNLRKVRELSDRLRQIRSLDLLCLPEMALTGYNFEDATSVAPFLEKPRTGITSTLCSDLAKRLGCFVTAGYPELLEPHELRQCILQDRIRIEDPVWGEPGSKKREIVGANSAVLYGPHGEWVGGYRKTNLFWTDKTWAAAGAGFTTFKLPPPINNLTLAICMDLNPFTPDRNDESWQYELADYCLTSKTDLLVLLNAWLDPGIEAEDEPSWKTLGYWAARSRPLWSKGNEPSDRDNSDYNRYTTLVICNRTGEENGVAFAGSSASFQMDRECGRPRIVDMMTKEEEGFRIFDLDLPSP